jgi:hypothetical protein
MRPKALLEILRIGLDPSENRRVVDLDAAVGQHHLEIAVADREHQVPTHGPEDDVGGELPPFERPVPHHRAGPVATLIDLPLLPEAGRHVNLQQIPPTRR